MWVTAAWLGQTEGPLAVTPGFIPTVCIGFFLNPFSFDGHLAQPRYSREGLGPSLKQCALPSLRSGWEWGKWREWDEERLHRVYEMAPSPTPHQFQPGLWVYVRTLEPC